MVCSVRSTILGSGAAPAQRPTRGATFWAIRVMDDQLFHDPFERDLVVRHLGVRLEHPQGAAPFELFEQSFVLVVVRACGVHRVRLGGEVVFGHKHRFGHAPICRFGHAASALEAFVVLCPMREHPFGQQKVGGNRHRPDYRLRLLRQNPANHSSNVSFKR